MDILDGFWLPTALRERALADVTLETYWLKDGAITTKAVAGAVGVRWPRFTSSQWHSLLEALQKARTIGGQEVLARWQSALEAVQSRLLDHAARVLPLLATGTGYSPEMLMAALLQGNLISAESLSAALRFRPTWSAATQWARIERLPGWARFYPERMLERAAAGLRRGAPLYRPAPPADLVLGYAAGNVPGTALLISLLGGLANYSRGDAMAAPAVLIRNSRHEPLFAPWVLSAVEAIDPDLVAGLAVLIWDYDEKKLQGELLHQAGLLIAAAGDDAITALDALRERYAPALRFHRHGHKVSFAVIESRALGGGHAQCARLAALDSSLWDQNGCLSARVHFVAGDADDYAQHLTAQMRTLASELPRGATPRRLVHRAFDTYASLVGSSAVRVCSTYDDDFMVALDQRPWNGETLSRVVNACMGRAIVVRRVDDVMEVPRYLRDLPSRNLQSVSLAMENTRVLELAEAVGACGVTAIRSLGRAAFPQLAYSWDGLLPLDAAFLRPAGHFTTVEFNDLQDEIAATTEQWKP